MSVKSGASTLYNGRFPISNRLDSQIEFNPKIKAEYE